MNNVFFFWLTFTELAEKLKGIKSIKKPGYKGGEGKKLMQRKAISTACETIEKQPLYYTVILIRFQNQTKIERLKKIYINRTMPGDWANTDIEQQQKNINWKSMRTKRMEQNI